MPQEKATIKNNNKNVEEFSAKKLEVEKKKDDHINSIAGQEQLKIALRSMRKYIEKNCENVGERFPQEARNIHYDKKTSKGIYGKENYTVRNSKIAGNR